MDQALQRLPFYLTNKAFEIWSFFDLIWKNRNNFQKFFYVILTIFNTLEII